MKDLPVLIMLCMSLALAGCTAEDNSVCFPRENVTLLFSLPDAAGNETFANNISAVDVMVYNSAGTYVLTRHVNKDDIAGFQGVRLLLEPGVYHLICWGNAINNTKYNGVENAAVPTVTYAVINAGNTVDNSDPLYSAGTAAVIPENKNWQDTAIFTTAHRQIEIYVKGYNENGNTLPNVELTNLPAGLCLSDMTRLPDRSVVDSRKATQSVTVQGQYYAAAHFRTFLFEANNSITINIISPITNKPVFDISLNEAMAQGVNTDPIVIRIVIEFKSTGVTVTLPNWKLEDVGFGFGHGY
jgi:hypothetical protein